MRHWPRALNFVLFILSFVNVGLLDLAHVWTFSWAPHVNTTRVGESEEQAEHEQSPREPQESGRGLGFSASAACIARAVCDVIASCVVPVAARASTKLSRHGYCGAEEEQSIE